MANPLRGEVDIVLTGKAYTLRPTFQALCELEQRVSCGLYQLAKRVEDGSFTVMDIACVIWSGIRGTLGLQSPPLEEVGEGIAREGVAAFVGPAAHYLAAALGGDSCNS